jgi:ABC-type branched-subunit amino acid transport system ATPase component
MAQNTLRHGILLPPFHPMESCRDVSFEVCQGELALLVGPYGSGKIVRFLA